MAKGDENGLRLALAVGVEWPPSLASICADSAAGRPITSPTLAPSGGGGLAGDAFVALGEAGSTMPTAS
eukprot:scaffold1300_cov235-Pinguiococcus_pyrenoidosus.AAC.1